MKYFDKSTGRTVELTESGSDFLLIGGTEGETLRALPTSDRFSIRLSTQGDGVAVLKLRSETESVPGIRSEIERLRRQDGVQAVVPALVDATGQTRYALPQRVNVVSRPEAADAIRNRVESLGGAITRVYRSPGTVEVSVPPGMELGAFIAALNQDDGVLLAEPAFYGVDDQEMRVTVSVAGGGPQGESLDAGGAAIAWNLANVRAHEAHALSAGDPTVVVAVVDGRPQLDHPALAGRFLWDDDDANVFSSSQELSSHATNVASVVAASGPVQGVAPAARILPVVVSLVAQRYAERADAIRYVAGVARNRRVGSTAIARVVLCCSWRTSGDVGIIRLALQDALAADVPIVCSAGNDNSGLAHFPSDYASPAQPLGEGLLSVAALDRADQRAPYSNYASAVTVSAPGGDGLPIDDRDVLCADVGDTVAWVAGTSIAAPHVAAVAALVLAATPALPCAQVKTLIAGTARDVSARNPAFEGRLGTGCVDAYAALRSALDAAPHPAPSEPAEPSEPSGPTQPAEPSGPSGPPGASEPTGGPAVSVSTVMAAEVRDVLIEHLSGCRDDLRARTGWQLSECLFEIGGQAVVLDTRPAEA
jgi:subtilisin family serine protease